MIADQVDTETTEMYKPAWKADRVWEYYLRENLYKNMCIIIIIINIFVKRHRQSYGGAEVFSSNLDASGSIKFGEANTLVPESQSAGEPSPGLSDMCEYVCQLARHKLTGSPRALHHHFRNLTFKNIRPTVFLLSHLYLLNFSVVSINI